MLQQTVAEVATLLKAALGNTGHLALNFDVILRTKGFSHDRLL